MHLTTSCLCGASRLEIQTCDNDSHPQDRDAKGGAIADVFLCHCKVCQKSSGGLWGSYFPCQKPGVGILEDSSLLAYEFKLEEGGDIEKRLFCGTCGGHMFRMMEKSNGAEEGIQGGERQLKKQSWEVATGALGLVEGIQVLSFVGHLNLSQQRDGGAAVWLREMPDLQGTVFFTGGKSDNLASNSSDTYSGFRQQDLVQHVDDSISILEPENGARADIRKEVLQACCLCQTVSFHITRPDASSSLPRSNFPDLMIPYHTQNLQIPNPNDEKWWLRGKRGAETKFLAGTCACRSCRLGSGFEIQPWAFVPRSNIYFHIPGTDGERETPLDFENDVFRGVLQSYESSEGVVREFCGTCGATVFWHDKWRPDLIDVSVGLLDAPEGMRAENWLHWWTERVSFEEDAVGHGRDLAGALGKGMAAWGGISKEIVREGAVASCSTS